MKEASTAAQRQTETTGILKGPATHVDAKTTDKSTFRGSDTAMLSTLGKRAFGRRCVAIGGLRVLRTGSCEGCQSLQLQFGSF